MMRLHNAQDWAQRTFGRAALGDSRRTKRLVDIGTRMARYSGKTVASSCAGEGALLEGTYRFIRNDKIDAQDIRQAGFQATGELAREIPELLALEDTTSLSYKHQVAPKLGKLGQITDKARGWWCHSSLLLNGHTLQTVGLAYQEWWCRPDDKHDADEKESGKWQAASAYYRQHFGQLLPNTIFVCDREADIFDYMNDKLRHEERFVVRARHLRKVNASSNDIFGHLAQQPRLGHYRIDIPQKGQVGKDGKRHNRVARTARLQLKSGTITIVQGKRQLTLNAVLAEEVSSPKGDEPLKWLLLTTEAIVTFEQAMRIIRIYGARWRIEDFHKAWKTGAGVERLRMVEPENLERTASILAFIGVRLLQLRESFTLAQSLKKQGLVAPAAEVARQSCDTVLTQDEWRVLVQLQKKKSQRPKSTPTLQWAYLAVAKLGGFSDSKRTGIAGWATLWQGWDRLQQLVQGYLLAKDMLDEHNSCYTI